MKSTFLLAIILFFGTASSLLAQDAQELPMMRAQSFVEAGIGLKANPTVYTIGYYRNWILSESKPFFDKFYIGTGVRFNGFSAQDMRFTSALPSLYKTSLADTIFTPAPAVYTVNAFLNIGYQLSSHMQLGLDIDVAGLSFGPNGSPIYLSKGKRQTVKVNPTPVNLLLVGVNNRGSLLSNIYLRYKFTDRWGARVSYQTFYAEITAEELLQTVPENNQRFRYVTKALGIGVNYQFR